MVLGRLTGGKKGGKKEKEGRVSPADSGSLPPVPAVPSDSMSVSGSSSDGLRTPGSRQTLTTIDETARYNSMVKYLYGRISANQWLGSAGTQNSNSGVLLRKHRGSYVYAPDDISGLLLAAVKKINAEVAFTMCTETIRVIVSSLEPGQKEVTMSDGSQLQVVGSLNDVANTSVKKFQYGCIVRKENMLLVWHDDLQNIIPHATRMEEKLLSLVWGSSLMNFGANTTGGNTAVGTPRTSIMNYPMEKKQPEVFAEEVDPDFDEEKGFTQPESLARPINLTSAVFVGLGMCLIVVLLFGLATKNLIVETLTDGNYMRLAFMAIIPLLMLVGMFFVVIIFTDIFQMIGPIGGVMSNSRFYSAVKPNLRRAAAEGFTPPHITIQMPVYKEGLAAVIIPTVNSLKAAISHYESHGGSASIFVNDDGLRLISPEDRQARLDFYQDNNIGWVARPKHGSEGYLRKGKFKKASNMNFALNISQKVEAYLQEMVEEKYAREGSDMLDEQEEDDMYQACLDRVLEENPLAQAAGNIRIGQYILIIDSDTRVPVDCLLYGAAEMFLSPEVAIVQHSTGVMQVQHDYFENGITFFTNMVYTSIRYSIGCGEVAPFVGHNAFLNWQAVQSVGVPEENNYIAYWSESHVSEDFDIALRLQIAGNIVRVASYHNNEFLEGVSLTVYDELARWQKYAYGCSELVFNPIHRWIFQGPFTKLFFTFLGSNMILSSKCTILAYIASYFALASGGPLTLMNYFLIGWFNGQLDKFYMESWKIFVALVVVFNIAGNVCLAVLRYRLGEKGLLQSMAENFKWMPMFTVFFGGLSFHLNCAILSHLFHVNMQWGATNKEAVKSNFFQEIPKIFKGFKYMYIMVVLVTGIMIYLGNFAPRGWEIEGATAIAPLAVTLISHALLPFLLNPNLMIFSY